MILKATNYLQELGYNETNLTELDRYSIGRVYLQMKSTMEMVGWWSIVWGNLGAPKWLFIMYLAINRRLATKDRLIKQKMIQSLTCPLYQQEDGALVYIFFQCSYVKKYGALYLHDKGLVEALWIE